MIIFEQKSVSFDLALYKASSNGISVRYVTADLGTKRRRKFYVRIGQGPATLFLVIYILNINSTGVVKFNGVVS